LLAYNYNKAKHPTMPLRLLVIPHKHMQAVDVMRAVANKVLDMNLNVSALQTIFGMALLAS
jgi:hypothetical protein